MTVSLGTVLLGAATAQVNADEPCVPQDAWTETIQHPAVTHTETVTVVDKAAWTEVIPAVTRTETLAVQRYSWNPMGPVDESITEPTWPVPQQGKWQENTSHWNGEDPIGQVFQQGGGNNGDNASWFYWTGRSETIVITPEQRIEHPAVTHTETATVVDKAAWTETINHPAVSCDVTDLEPAVVFTDATCDTLGEESWDGTLEAFLDYEATGEVGPGETVTVESMIETGYVDEYEFAEGAQTEFTHTFAEITLEDCVQGEETVIPKPDKPEPKPDKKPTVKGVEVVAPPAAAPTAVAAGLGGDIGSSTGQLFGQGLTGLGLVMLLAAGWLSVPRHVRGVHES
jgi:hypothetical protein